MWELTEIYCKRIRKWPSEIFLPVSEWKVPTTFYSCKDFFRFDVWTCFQECITAVEHNGYYHVPWRQTDLSQTPALGQVVYPLWAWIYFSCLSQRIVVKIKWDFFLSQNNALQIEFQNVCSHYHHHYHHHHHGGMCVEGEHCLYWCFSCVKLWYNSKPL